MGRPLAEPRDADADEQDYESAGAATIPAGETTAPIEIAVVVDAGIEPARNGPVSQ